MDTLPPHNQDDNINNKNELHFPAWPTTPGIYMITCTISSHRYIGSAKNLRERRYKHFYSLRKNKHVNPHLQYAYSLYGESAFTTDILEHVEVLSDLIIREQHYIDILIPEYNISKVVGRTNLGRTFPDEVRKKIAASKKGKPGPILSEEHKTKLREINTGHIPSEETRRKWSEQRTGRRHTEESKAKMSRSRKGRQTSPETRAKLSKAFKGRIISEEQRQKQRETMLKRPPDSEETRQKKGAAWQGRRHTEETKQKMSEKGLENARKRKEKMGEIRLKYWRKERGFTVLGLASASHVAKSMISAIEANQKTPRLETLQKLAKALEISLEQLVVQTDTNQLGSSE